MEMTITVHLPRRRPHPVDLVVRWAGEHTAVDLAAALEDHLHEPVPVLAAGGRTVDPNTVVGMPPLVHGASLTVGESSSRDTARAAGSVLDLAVVGGPDSGRSRPLVPPGLHIGRSASCGLAVDDEALSRVHARVRVGASGVQVEDAGSTNGVLVDGRPTDGATSVDGSSTIVMGATTVRVRRGGGSGLAVQAPGDGTLLVRLPGSPPTPVGPVEVECPQAPTAPHRARVPWLGALVPVPIALVLAVVVGPQLLLFALLGPLVLLGNVATDRWGAGRAHRRALGAYDAARRAAQDRLDRALSDEVVRLDAGHPDPHAVLTIAEGRLPRLWRGGDLGVRLGLGEVRTRVAWLEGSARSHPIAHHAPVVVDLGEVRCLGIVGPPATTDRLLANIVGQLCTRHPPDRLTVTVADRGPSWAWTIRMPHTSSRWPPGPPGPPGPPAAEWPSAGGQPGAPLPASKGVLVVPSPGGDGVAGGIEGFRAAGVPVVVAATHVSGLPPACAAVVEATEDGRHALTRDGERTPLTLDLVGPWWAERVSRALAPLRPDEAEHPGALHDAVTLCELLGEDRLTPDGILGRWDRATGDGRSASAPLAAVGRGPQGVHRIDLRRDGPHVLVGGTTGSGKSEFLRTLVTALAVGSPAADLCFVLVDFKGGAAFGPCAELPHVVGMVTDLDDHLVARALTSLGAELRRRETVFAAVGASDLDGYLRCRGPDDEQVPRLVIVVDELRALVEQVPEFVSGMVRLAALGRSLGVHLVLATQRPAGVITAEIQANVNLRIAFRVRDRSDSLAILDDGTAASLPPDTPGMAVASSGDGVLTSFRAAVVAPARRTSGRHLSVAQICGSEAGQSNDPGTATAAAEGNRVDVHEHPRAADERLAEIADVVSAVVEAHRRRGATVPAPPWVPPLPSSVDPLSGVEHRQGAVVAGLVDEPELQRTSPLLWETASGTWLLSGRPRSGRTTAARAVALAAAATEDAGALHLHVIDTGGSLADLGALPHTGTHVRSDDTATVTALVAHLRSEVDRRRRMPDPGRAAAPRVLVVVDGWERLVEADPVGVLAGPADDLVRVLRDGEGVGVTGVVTGGRGLLQASWSALGATVFLLGTADSLDAALAGLRASDLPTSPPAGRAVRVSDRRSVQFATATPRTIEAVAGRARATVPPVSGAGPLVLRPLPTVVRRRDAVPLLRQNGDAPLPDAGETVTRLPVGVAGHSAGTWEWVPERMGRRLLVAGPPRSGRTNTLRVLELAALEAGLPVAVVSAASSDQHGSWSGIPLGPHDVEALVALRRTRPDLVLLVDGGDRLDDAPVVGAIRELSGLLDRDGGLLVVSTTPTAVLGRFRGVDVETARHRTGLLLTPGATDGDVFGLRRRASDIPSNAGRGLACTPSGVTELQVFLADDAPGHGDSASAGVRTLTGLVHVPRGDGRGRADHADGNHRPADEPLVALDEPDPYGQQQQVPDHGRRSGPRGAADPSSAHHGQGDPAEQDEQRGHEHPRRVAPLPDGELVHVEAREGHEGQCLQPDEHRGEAAGAA